MKNSIYLLASLLMFIVTSPIFAQADLTDDPDVPAPIDDYLFVLIIVAITFAVFKFRAIYKQNLRAEN